MSVTDVALKDQGNAEIQQRLPFNLTQLLAFAMQKPRNPLHAIDNAIAQLRATPQFAEKAYYSIPFKRKDGSTEMVEGPSIKAATALTGCWGNNIEGAFIGQETEDYIDVSGYFFDYETGKLTIRPYRVSKMFKTHEGKVIPWRKDMLDKQLAAGVSKAIRNADLNGLPAGLVAEYYAEAKRIAAHGGKIKGQAKPEDVGMAQENVTAKLERLGVSREAIAAYIMSKAELTSEEEVTAHLIGVLNAINDGHTTVEDVFAGEPEAIAEPQRKSALATTAAPSGKYKRMKSFVKDGKCGGCPKPIVKGDEINWDAAGRVAYHLTCTPK